MCRLPFYIKNSNCTKCILRIKAVLIPFQKYQFLSYYVIRESLPYGWNAFVSIFSFSRNAFNCEFSSCTARFIEKTMKYHVGNNIQIRNWQKSIYTLKIHLKTRQNNGNGNSSHSIHYARWKGYDYYFMQNSSLDMAINAIVTLQNKWTQSNHVNEIQNDKFLSTRFILFNLIGTKLEIYRIQSKWLFLGNFIL